MAVAILTTEQLRTMDRYELVATWLVLVTSRKAGREQTGGMKVTRAAAGFRITYPEVGDGSAALFAGNAEGLLDYARRTRLGAQIRVVEEAREAAFMASP